MLAVAPHGRCVGLVNREQRSLSTGRDCARESSIGRVKSAGGASDVQSFRRDSH